VGAVADVVLWRRKEVATVTLAAVVASWTLFYCVPGKVTADGGGVTAR
jgi:reticulon-3